MKKIVLVFMVVGILGLGLILHKNLKYQKETVPAAVEISVVAAKTNQKAKSKPLATMKTVLPKELNLKLPFYPQAPYGNWDYPWQEACEEASVLLVANAYYEHNWTREQFKDEILKLVDWQNEKFGDYWHTTMEQTARILNDYLGLSTKIHENPSFEDIQKILAKGHLMIVPAAGKQLGNPFFRNGGPMYHVMVIKGYKAGEKIITHDVGTRRGEDYVYTWETLLEAMHDYAKPMESGAQRIIEVFSPKAGF